MKTLARLSGAAWVRFEAERGRFLEILALTSFIVAQPVLDVFGSSPETFVYRGAGRVDLVLFALLVTLVPAVALWLIGGAAARIGDGARRVSQNVIIWMLLALLGIQVIKKFTPLVGVWLGLVGGLIGIVLTWGVLRFDVVRRWLRFAWPASVAFVLIFLLLSPVSALVLPQPMGKAAAAKAARVPVVMVVFDQLPMASLINAEGQIDGDRFPNFARLARRSTWYRNYTVTEAYTEYSVPTILTGRLARDRSKKVVAADYPDNLFTLLRETHDPHVVSVTGGLCPEDLCSKTIQEPDSVSGGSGSLLEDAAGIWFDISLPGVVTRDIAAQFEEPAEEAAAEVEEPTPEDRRAHVRRHRVPLSYTEFAESLHRDGRPGLHFLHLLLPHFPWRFFPSGLEYERPRGDRDLPLEPESSPKTWLTEPWPVELAHQRHILQVQFVDRLVGDLIDRLQEAGIYDEALVVVTSDHGHSFRPGHPRAAPTMENIHEILWVPLIVKAPHQEGGRVDDANITAPDLLPTIADLLGVEIPWSIDGTSALARGADRGPVKTFIRHRDGKRVPWPTGTLAIPVAEAWARLRSGAFQPETAWSDPSLLPYLVGPHPELIGKRVADLEIGDVLSLDVQLDAPEALRAVELEGGIVPALISGTAPAASDGTNIAVALNGRIAGVSPTFTLNGEVGRFEILALDALFRSGRNTVEIFVIDDGLLRPMRPDHER